jgi:hypothetical protein
MNAGKIFIVTIAALILLSGISFGKTCDVNEARSSLRKALYDYLQTPSTSTMSKEEIKDLLEFYLSIPQGQTSADCSSSGAYSATKLEDIVDQAKGLNKTIPVCSDGTEYGFCANEKPKMCYAGSMVSKCGICGCPGGFFCSGSNGKCLRITGDASSIQTSSLQSTSTAPITSTTPTTSSAQTTTVGGNFCNPSDPIDNSYGVLYYVHCSDSNGAHTAPGCQFMASGEYKIYWAYKCENNFCKDSWPIAAYCIIPTITTTSVITTTTSQTTSTIPTNASGPDLTVVSISSPKWDVTSNVTHFTATIKNIGSSLTTQGIVWTFWSGAWKDTVGWTNDYVGNTGPVSMNTGDTITVSLVWNYSVGSVFGLPFTPSFMVDSYDQYCSCTLAPGKTGGSIVESNESNNWANTTLNLIALNPLTDCSRACTPKCPQTSYTCCDGCNFGKVDPWSHMCMCTSSPQICSNPAYQVESTCSASSTSSTTTSVISTTTTILNAKVSPNLVIIKESSDPLGIPDMSGRAVIWQKSVYASPIIGYDFKNGMEYLVSSNMTQHCSMLGPNGMDDGTPTECTYQAQEGYTWGVQISGSKVVYEEGNHVCYFPDTRSPTGYSNIICDDINGYDFNTRDNFVVSSSGCNKHYPKIDGNNVVWGCFSNGLYDSSIKKDISTGQAEQILSTYYNMLQGALSRDVFVNMRNIVNLTSGDIYNYTDAYVDQVSVSGDKIAFVKGHESSSTIYVYGMKSRSTIPIDTNATNLYRYVSVDGDLVAYSKVAGLNSVYELYLFNLTSGIRTRLTNTVGKGHPYPIVDSNRVLYTSNDNGVYRLYLYSTKAFSCGDGICLSMDGETHSNCPNDCS